MTDIILQYDQGRYLRCTIDQVLGDCDNTPASRLTKVLFEKGLIGAQEVLDILRPRGEYSAGPDEDYYHDRKF